jgi:hypothetical protein
MPGDGFLPCNLFMAAVGGPEFPAQTRDDQQDKQAKQPATGIAGSGGLH